MDLGIELRDGSAVFYGCGGSGENTTKLFSRPVGALRAHRIELLVFNDLRAICTRFA
jgi:hypothetical protein